jgi:LuxR family transcriptional regulator/LuxR family quorum-sensing system transcriptional regulator CciR
VDPAEFELAVDRASRPDDLWRLMVDYARACGATRIGYHHLPPPGAPDSAMLRVENAGFGDALLAQYLAARVSGIAALADAVHRVGRPVYLSELLDGLVRLSPRARVHLEGYRAAGIVNGLSLEAFGPNGRNGIFAFDLGTTERLAPAALGRLRWACQVMHLRYCELLLPTLGDLPNLSAREAEVLRWVARGKSNAAIAEILGISAHTVDAHLRRIYLKLGVFDRISAALRALGFGLIKIEG